MPNARAPSELLKIWWTMGHGTKSRPGTLRRRIAEPRDR
jgi:hypothetical protein